MKNAMIAAALSMTTIAGAAPAAPLSSEREALEATVRAFAGAADQRDVPALEHVLTPDFRLLVTMNGGEPTRLARADYLALVRQGKIGGGERSVRVDLVRSAGRFAVVGATLERVDARFEAIYVLARGADGWQLVQESTSVTPRTKG